jgi:sulfate adenylyltransferase subunit 1 (EFTu-like GTPase family)
VIVAVNKMDLVGKKCIIKIKADFEALNAKSTLRAKCYIPEFALTDNNG